MTKKNVHTEHCCLLHGCKYGDKDCPVATGIQKQSFPCESCDPNENVLTLPKNIRQHLMKQKAKN